MSGPQVSMKCLQTANTNRQQHRQQAHICNGQVGHDSFKCNLGGDFNASTMLENKEACRPYILGRGLNDSTKENR